MNARIAGLLFMGAALLAGVQPAFAYPVTIYIEAEVDSVEDDDNYLEGQINPGSLITGFYIYESTTPDSSPTDPVQGNYWHYYPPAGLFLTVGGFDFMTDPCDVEFNVFIRNNNPNDDIYGVDSLNNLPLSNGTIVDAIYWSLKDHTASVFSSDALPTTAPSLDQWDENLLRLRTDRIFLIDAHVTSAIPEPTTFVLFGLSGFLLARA